MFDLLSKRNVEKIKKMWHILLFLAIFSTTEPPGKKNFLFKKQKFYVDNKCAKFHEV